MAGFYAGGPAVWSQSRFEVAVNVPDARQIGDGGTAEPGLPIAYRPSRIAHGG
ncbi:MAG: hypothetical protein K2X78_08775 [Burkholderiaceae bacterium]|nr:hypothetical protein [Burkholderiaceae bacterium]